MTQLPPDVEAAVRRAEELTARRYEPLLRAAARHGGGWVEITDGLGEGARVVVHPDRELEDGTRVRER